MVSAIALVDADNKVLIAQRPKNKFMEGFWEFPGGKLEANELHGDCIIREVKAVSYTHLTLPTKA